ncbi:helix-turn-helix domain-containing protein [Roseomonas genomospecies 6]|uniref:MarR family transcriptional regulator n=1 Tax=Roseomonas genomospecies 6 TaxID=214106 RepID=A0A9W7KQB7_9PROT|nr:helix-turn-helix domain-containing protein [Roseomonas genomospecies 6]KAA0677596.1 MarR family transcriptional regulator [Roseomonas genomospecies 6]
MTKTRSLTDLRDELRSAARGERPAPDWLKAERQPLPNFFSVMTDGNRELMQLIGERHPATVSELAEMAGRKMSNVSRSLQDLARVGLVRLVREGMSIRPELVAREVKVNLAHNTCELIAAE